MLSSCVIYLNITVYFPLSILYLANHAPPPSLIWSLVAYMVVHLGTSFPKRVCKFFLHGSSSREINASIFVFDEAIFNCKGAHSILTTSYSATKKLAEEPMCVAKKRLPLQNKQKRDPKSYIHQALKLNMIKTQGICVEDVSGYLIKKMFQVYHQCPCVSLLQNFLFLRIYLPSILLLIKPLLFGIIFCARL